jgi:chromosomal replication initiator protein
VTTSSLEVVAALAQAIRQRIGDKRYDLWFERHAKFHWDGDLLTVGVPNLHFQEWLQKTFGEAVQAAAAKVIGRSLEVRFVIDPGLFQEARRQQAEVLNAALAPCLEGRENEQGPYTPPVIAEPKITRRKEGPSGPETGRSRHSRRWHRLSAFVVGPCNRVAQAAAVSVVEAPGQGPNPLVLHGPVGTGKTHLLEGIYAGLRQAHPHQRICLVTAEDFTNRFVQAMRLGKLPAFRKHFRECDALLVDDLHFLAAKKATQEEFLHTLDTVLCDGRPLVVTCDCHPRLAGEFTPELTDRLLGGAVWGVAPPDAETRYRILAFKAAEAKGPVIPEEVLRLVADQLRGNVRELEGALHSLRHYANLTGRAIDDALAREALAELLQHAVRVVQLPDIEAAVCRVLRLPNGALRAKGRSWAVSHPRMLAIYLARKHTAAAYSEVGHYFGGRNHSTAVAAEKKVRHWLQENGTVLQGERAIAVRTVIELVERELWR